MTIDFFIAQALNGLAHATALFLMAAGLGLIFGVTRIVNFAHGGLYMLGAYLTAYAVTNWFPTWGESAPLYLLAMSLSVALCAVVGMVIERLVLRRLVGAPELVALVATFGLGLVVHDLMRWGFGVQEVFAPRFPGLKGAVEVAGANFPIYHLVTVVLGPVVWLALHWFLMKTRMGAQLRAATQDRSMLAALGVNPRPLFAAAVALGCALAGLGGALSVPISPVSLQMDMQIIVETFVVVVTGGLGSITGAFLAALLIGFVHSFGLALVPEVSLALVFGVMGLVLLVRPHGLLGDAQQTPASSVHPAPVFFNISTKAFGLVACALLVTTLLMQLGGAYWRSVWLDALILLVFAISLQLAMSLGGMVSFGHAAYLGLGAYGTALTGWAGGGVLAAGVLAVVFGWVVIRSSGVYLAMLSLALAQVLWAVASQWTAVTGGDNGLTGLTGLLDLASFLSPEAFAWGVALIAIMAVWFLHAFSRSRWGWTLQAVRDAPQRAAASGLHVHGWRYGTYVASAALAALAGALWVVHKGAVFPSILSVETSLDALLVVLLGGAHHVLGALVGSAVMTLLSSELGRLFDYWRGVLGLIVLLLMLFAPRGLLGRRVG